MSVAQEPSLLDAIVCALPLPLAASRTLTDRVAIAIVTWRLTRRMAETLLLIAAGLSNKEIAASRDRAEVTVEYHVSALMRRAGVDTRGRLVAKFWLELPRADGPESGMAPAACGRGSEG